MSNKKAYIITGPESSGSVFISRVVSYVVGKDASYGQWDGYGMNGKIGDDIVCLHRSQPYANAETYYTLEQYQEDFSGYDIYFIVTTRDMHISAISKAKRFKRNQKEILENKKVSREILTRIMSSNEKSFVWSYETMLYLGEAYFKKLYEFLKVDSSFVPGDMKDGNKKYIS
jgi:hypothetical protein